MLAVYRRPLAASGFMQALGMAPRPPRHRERLWQGFLSAWKRWPGRKRHPSNVVGHCMNWLYNQLT